MRVRVVACLLFAVLSAASVASPMVPAGAGGPTDGDIDTSFGTNGVVDLPKFLGPSRNMRVGNIVAGAGGRVVLSGRAGGTAVAVRYLRDGTRDAAFGDAGVLKSRGDGCTGLGAVLPDGRFRLITIAPRADGDPPQLRVTGVLADGHTRDHALGAAGYRDINAGSRCPTSVAVAGTRLLLAAPGPAQLSTTLVAVTAGGALDPTFGSSGRVTFLRYATDDIETLPGGRVVVAQHRNDYRVVGLTAAGTLDAGFARGGMLARDGTTELTATPSGRLVTATSTSGSGECSAQDLNVVVERLLASGAPDPGFEPSENLTPECIERVVDVAVDPGRRIVVTIDAVNLTVARLQNDGSTDTSFSGDGAAQLAPSDRGAAGVAPSSARSDGSIVTAADPSATNTGRMELFGTDTSGVADAQWAGGQPVVDDVRVLLTTSADVIASDGDALIIAGNAHLTYGTGKQGPLTVVRILDDGTIDTTFGTNGIANPFPADIVLPLAVRVTANNVIIAIATVDQYGLVYLTRNGTIDEAAGRGVRLHDGAAAVRARFDNGGRVVFGFATGNASLRRVLRNGTIDAGYNFTFASPCGGTSFLDVARAGDAVAVCVRRESSSHFVTYIARVDATGAPINSFGNGGVATTGIYPTDVSLNAVGRVTITGGIDAGASPGVARLGPDGLPDPVFNGGERLVTLLPAGPVERDSDGRTYVATQFSAISTGLLNRLHFGGAVDASFAPHDGGPLTFPGRTIRTISLADDSRLVVASAAAGTSDAASRLHQFVVSRATP